MANLTNSNKLIEKIDNLNVVRVSNTAPSNPTLGMAWYDSTSSSKMLKIYNGTSWDIVGPEMIPITQDAYDALSPAEKNNGKYYLITDAEGTIIVNWEDIVGAPTIPENTSDLNNDSGFITGINSSDVTTALGFTPYNASNPSGYQTASQVSSAINTALGSVYRYKGSKTTYSQLPTSGQITGDVWNIEQADSEHGIKAGDNVAWNGSAWDVLSGTIDLTNYFNKTTDNSDSITQGSNNLFLTGAERTKLSNLSGTNTGDETTATIKTKLGAASASQDGYLKKEDFATFNGKQDALTAGDGITIENGVISSEGESYNAGEGISIEDISINGRQGPSPDGFHVPSTTEWQGLNTIMTSLSLTTGDNWRINLHMPFAGRRDYSDASLINQGSYGNYWSSSPSSAGSYNARRLYLYSSDVYAGNLDYRARGLSVRCFKDSYVVPDSSWTIVQGSLGSAGIFWNQSQGLISITDGSTGYTMMDKNLGATTVYNDGDTLTQANMGNMYQWGNNYGFPSTGTITNTSSTQVDASAYGPTNPYSSDTFITGSNDWSSVQNDDLWGDTTGTVTQENVISNTGVLSVNGQTGNVTIDSGSYTAGEGIDITNNEISLNAEFMTQSAYDNITPESGKYYLIYEHRYPDISISVSSNYEGQTPGYYDEVQFIVRVTNDGDSAITINTESQLTQDYYSNTFNPGQTREYEFNYTVEDIEIKDGSFVFDVTASEEDNPENTITYTKTIITEPIQYPTLSIQITPSQQSAQLYDLVDFDISVTNNSYYINEVNITTSLGSEWGPEIHGGETVDLQDNRTITQANVTQGSFTFTVTAQESGNSQNTATASVTIPVTS